MAQLIKLQDYVTRYETDMSRYPAQYVRLKKQQWENLKAAWESGTLRFDNEFSNQEIFEEKQSIFNKVRGWFSREDETIVEELDIQLEKEEEDFAFRNFLHAANEQELTHEFLVHIFCFQIKWAIATIHEIFFVNEAF